MRASDDEIEALRATVRDFLGREAAGAFPPPEDGGAYDRILWRGLVRDLSLIGIGIPEDLGGAGYSFSELGVVLEELGATLAPVPFLSTAVAAAAVLAVGDPAARSALLPVLAAGDVVGAAVLTGTTFVAEERDSGWVVTGTASHVADGTHADLFVVCADTGAGEAVLAVATDSPGVRVRSLTSLDVLRPIAALELTEAAATLIGRAPDVGEWPALDVAVSAQLVAVACEQVGGAARCLHTTVEYLKTREQFGVPIGTFQALKHRCADMLTALEAARSIAYDTRDRVAAALDGAGRDTIRAAAAAAACWCSDTYVRIAQENVQMHGGIGFTWEHDAHLHVRRSRADQLLYGTPRQHRAVVAAALGI